MSTVGSNLAEVHVEPLRVLVADLLRRVALQRTPLTIEVCVRVILTETTADHDPVAGAERNDLSRVRLKSKLTSSLQESLDTSVSTDHVHVDVC